MSGLVFTRRRVRGGIVRIEVDGRFAGEIATCKWGYALRLCGVYWTAEGRPANGGFSQQGFKRQHQAVAFVRQMDDDWLRHAADVAALYGMTMA